MANSIGIGFRGPREATVVTMTKRKKSVCALHFGSCLSIGARKAATEEGKIASLTLIS